QRRTGTRHADDEHRYRGRLADALLLVYELEGEYLLDTSKLAECGRFVIINLLAFEGIALQQMPERRLMFAEVTIGSAQRKSKVYPIFRGEGGCLARQLFHRGKRGIADGKSL